MIPKSIQLLDMARQMQILFLAVILGACAAYDEYVDSSGTYVNKYTKTLYRWLLCRLR